MHTYVSTDWIEVGGIGLSTMVKVVLTDESEAYLISVAKAGKPEAEVFKLDAKYLYDNKKDFFNAAMDAWGDAEKLPVERAFDMRILTQPEIKDIINKIG